jgi:hypothetical protein
MLIYLTKNKKTTGQTRPCASWADTQSMFAVQHNGNLGRYFDSDQKCGIARILIKR